MIKSCAVCLLVLCSLLLSSCNLANGGVSTVSRMFQAVGRSAGMGAGNNAAKPFRLESGEIEKARGAGSLTPLPEPAETADHVASR